MLVAEYITKKFPGVVALDNVCLEFHPGKVNAVIGENGAGKSTLMKILSGVYADFEGRILYDNRQVRFSNPKDAQAHGISIIHQELNLIPYLSITENIFLGREITTAWGTLKKGEMRTQTVKLLSRLKLNVDPDMPVYQLKVGQQQVVEIAKALLGESDVIIMDEPTSAISENEVDVLFSIIADLKNEGKTIVYISHKLDELFRIADRFVVLRDGRSVDAGEMKGMDHDSLINKMVGRDLLKMQKSSSEKNAGTVLSVKGLCLNHPVGYQPVLNNIDLVVKRGEIVGIFGLMGSGRTELLETLFGMHSKLSRGNISVDNKPARFRTPSDAIKAGMGLLPEDRKKDGLVLGMHVRSNINLATLENMEVFGMLDNGKEVKQSNRYIGELQIKTPNDKQIANNLSGGNQQKIVLAKWLATNPKLLMLDEPTRGIDINAKNEIYKLILKLAGEGMGIIMVSSELPEILAISDRILVMSEGRVTGEFEAGEATEDKIMRSALSLTSQASDG